jgi:hypothetical protein
MLLVCSILSGSGLLIDSAGVVSHLFEEQKKGNLRLRSVKE